MDEVDKHRRNIYVMYFDYKKAFDSIPHEWQFEAMKLAKIPAQLINVIRNLSKKWSTKVSMQTVETNTITGII